MSEEKSMAAGWIKKAATEWLVGKAPDGFKLDPRVEKSVDSLAEVIARNVPQPQILVPQGSAPDGHLDSAQAGPDSYRGLERGLPIKVIEELRDLARNLVQKPIDPAKPAQRQAKQYVMFDDAVAALQKAFEMGAARDVPQSKPEPKEKA